MIIAYHGLVFAAINDRLVPRPASSIANPSKPLKVAAFAATMSACGFMLHALVHAADIQDSPCDSEASSLRESCDGAPLVLGAVRYTHPWLRHVFVDGGYTDDKLANALKDMGE
jgi:hypothetical protein